MWSNFTPSCMVHLDLKLTHVECHPEKILVYFWGQCCNTHELDYHILQTEIQTAAKTKADVAVDELCFVEDTYRGEWYRGRVVRKKEESYDVFLIDVGMVLTVDAGYIASASKKLFQLPPKVVCGIFANIIPIRRKWSSVAVKYFASLTSTQIKGYVEDVLMNQLVLEVPSVNQKLLELGLAKILDGSTFHFLLEMSEDLPRYLGYENAKMKSINKQCWRPMLDKTITRSLSFKHIVDVFSLSLQTDVIESVRITCASGLHNFYCQLKKLTSELEAMSKDMHDYYENKEKELNDEHINNSGALCAAKCRDGKWYRAVVKQLLTSGHVEVWLMDYGSIAVVLPHHIKQLMPDFFMMPVMSFPCAITDLAKQTKHWISLQIEIFKQSLFEEGLNIFIDSYSCIEHLYYVTLCNPQNINIHQLPETLSGVNRKTKYAADEKASKDISRQFGKSRGKLASNSVHYGIRSAEMKVNVPYVGFVEYVINPSDFWIRTSEYSHDFECLMNSISDHYSKIGVSDELIQKPAPGLFCCAMYSGDLRYYRAVITDIFDGYLKVFFVDYGNTEIVDVTAVKSLLPQYTHLPSLAMNCSIARIFPFEEVWTKDATNFFKKAVFNKEISIEVVSKEGSRYIIDIRDKECMEQPSVSTLMLKSGYADFWNVKAEDNLPEQNCKLKHSGNKAIGFTRSGKRTYIVKNSKLKNTCIVPDSLNKLSTLYFPTLSPIMSTRTEKSLLVSPFRQQVFKLGSVFDVRVSHVKSPAEFWCQLQSKSDELELLMRDIQLYYSIPRDPFQPKGTGCVAKYSKDGQWYRATVIQRNVPKEVTVLFVDYGIQQKTILKNLCAINPKFVQLEEQAFNCTINGIIQSVNQDPAVWDQASYNTFKQFIDKTLTSDLNLKCTIFAKALKDGKVLCNVVDLHTPYTNLCQVFLNMGLATNVKSLFSFSSSFQLYTFYYSDHDIRIGSEEKVYVTHASGLSEFYCQLEKNTLVVDKLITDITRISKQIQGQKLNFNKNCMCLAKYFEDGQWYRALAYSAQSPAHFKVFFVDYGNTEIVDENDVIPIPPAAKELISIPMQAVKCCLHLPLQKVPDDFTLFKETVMEKQLKAFVVARKSDGQLVLDLYDGNVKISDEITQRLYGSGVRCLDNTQWQSSNSSSLKNIVTFSKQKREHFVKETEGSISSDLKADTWYKGRQNKDQSGSFKNTKVPCKRDGKNTTYLQLKKFAPGYNFHQTNLGKGYITRNTGKAVQSDKTRFCVWKPKMIPHKINSREMTTPTALRSPVQNIAAVPNAKDGSEIICRKKEKTASFPQDFTKLFGMFDSGIWKINAASLSEKHKVFYASDAATILKACLFDLDGWMNKMACADVITASAKHVLLKSLLPGENARQCFSSLNLIACGPIQLAKEYSGFASSVIDPSEFYIQLDNTFETMITLSSFLAELPENLQTLSFDSLEVGVACLIKCASSNHWCRIEICAVSQQLVLARAVDYGYYIFIQPSDFSRICALPQELVDLPRLTNRCILNGVVPAKGDFWTDEAIVFFQKSLNKQNLTVVFRQYFAQLVWEVDVVINNKSVAEDLVAAGHAAFLKEIVNSSTEDALSSSEVFRILAGPISNRHLINMVSCSLSRRKPINEQFEARYLPKLSAPPVLLEPHPKLKTSTFPPESSHQ